MINSRHVSKEGEQFPLLVFDLDACLLRDVDQSLGLVSETTQAIWKRRLFHFQYYSKAESKEVILPADCKTTTMAMESEVCVTSSFDCKPNETIAPEEKTKHIVYWIYGIERVLNFLHMRGWNVWFFSSGSRKRNVLVIENLYQSFAELTPFFKNVKIFSKRNLSKKGEKNLSFHFHTHSISDFLFVDDQPDRVALEHHPVLLVPNLKSNWGSRSPQDVSLFCLQEKFLISVWKQLEHEREMEKSTKNHVPKIRELLHQGKISLCPTYLIHLKPGEFWAESVDPFLLWLDHLAKCKKISHLSHLGTDNDHFHPLLNAITHGHWTWFDLSSQKHRILFPENLELWQQSRNRTGTKRKRDDLSLWKTIPFNRNAFLQVLTAVKERKSKSPRGNLSSHYCTRVFLTFSFQHECASSTKVNKEEGSAKNKPKKTPPQVSVKNGILFWESKVISSQGHLKFKSEKICVEIL